MREREGEEKEREKKKEGSLERMHIGKGSEWEPVGGKEKGCFKHTLWSCILASHRHGTHYVLSTGFGDHCVNFSWMVFAIPPAPWPRAHICLPLPIPSTRWRRLVKTEVYLCLVCA